jgi:hypothetical protein
MDIPLTLELTANEIRQLEQNYLHHLRPDELDLEERILRGNYQRGYLTREELQDILSWKNPRFAHLADNSELRVNRVTRNALRAVAIFGSSQGIIELTELSGVAVRTATAILHITYSNPTLVISPALPILDVNALKATTERCYWEQAGEIDHLWDLRIWSAYRRFCVEKALEMGLSMRTLDRALWMRGSELE